MERPTKPASPVDDAKPEGEERYFHQRQSTMDSATLDKLLMAEKHLFHAGQATLQAWKLIGRDPDAESSGAAHPNAQAAASLNAAVQSAAAQASSQRYNERESDLTLGHLATPAARAQPQNVPSNDRSFDGSAGSSNLSSSPKLAMEIPRPLPEGGRGSFGQYSNASSANGPSHPSSYSARSTSTLSADALAESNYLAENGRSKSSHANIFGLNARGDTLSAPRSDITLFHFTVRKSDSVLEKLGSKKATIQLQVDIEARMLNFISPHENRESYSCAAVTARPQSRLGMQLKIQTGTTSLTKKINFLSTEERSNFIDALEQGKVMSKKGIPPFRGTEVSTVSDDATVVSMESSRAKLRESIMNDNFIPYCAAYQIVQILDLTCEWAIAFWIAVGLRGGEDLERGSTNPFLDGEPFSFLF